MMLTACGNSSNVRVFSPCSMEASGFQFARSRVNSSPGALDVSDVHFQFPHSAAYTTNSFRNLSPTSQLAPHTHAESRASHLSPHSSSSSRLRSRLGIMHLPLFRIVVVVPNHPNRVSPVITPFASAKTSYHSPINADSPSNSNLQQNALQTCCGLTC